MQADKRQVVISIAPGTLLAIVALVGAGILLPQLAGILSLLTLGLVVAAALVPLDMWAKNKLKLKGALAPLLVFFLVFDAVGLLILSMAPLVALQAGQFAEELPRISAKAQASWTWLLDLGGRFGLAERMDDIVKFLTERASQALRGTATAAGAVLSGMATFASVLLIAFFLLLDGELLRNGFVRLFPVESRRRVDALFDPITARLGAYVRGVLTNMAALGGMLAIGYTIVGLPFGLVIGVLTGLLEIIPVVGGLIGGVVAILVGFTVDLKIGIAAIVVFGIAQVLQNNVISPIVMAKAVEMPPVVLLLALLVGSQLLGLTGAIIAVPVAAAIMVLIDQVWVPAMEGSSLAAPTAGQTNAPGPVRDLPAASPPPETEPPPAGG
jgi:predicted PurR-regulated permease PerM